MSNAAEPGRAPDRTVVIGLGNEDRTDDGAGPLTARRLISRVPSAIRVAPDPGDAAALLDLWDGMGVAYVIDAAQSGRAAGTILRWERGTDGPLPPTRASSTHGLSVAEAIGLGEALQRLPSRLVVFAIEARTLAPGRPCSPEVDRASSEVAERILSEIALGRNPDREVSTPHA